MGREVRRVALDFEWPLKKTWEGFLNPHYRQCSACEGSGMTSARQRLNELVRLILLSGEDTVRKRGTLPHPYFSEMGSLYHMHDKVVSPDMLQIADGLAGQKMSESAFGFCSSGSWRATKKIVAAAGLDEKWGYCPVCDGEGEDPTTKAASDAWKETPPPKGDGWQMWETTPKGSPISPVFASPEELARWLGRQQGVIDPSACPWTSWPVP